MRSWSRPSGCSEWSDCRTLVVNDVDEFCVQIIVLCAKVSEDNALDVDFEEGAYDELRVLAMGIKRCVAFVRKAFIKQHRPQDMWFCKYMQVHA